MPDPTVVSRVCPRCGKLFTKAGWIVDGQPLCPTCGNAARPPMTCVACSRPTKRPARSERHGDLICEPCARRDTHATCRVCRRHRPIAERNQDGNPVCRDCSGAAPVTHDCPDCGRMVPGGGLSPCAPCGLRRRTTRAAHAAAGSLRQPWARELLVAFYTSLDYDRMPGDMARRVPASAAFVAVLEAGLSGIGEIDQISLLDLHGAEGLRRQERLVAFLVNRLALRWDGQASVAHSARRVARAALDGAIGASWSKDLAAFSAALERSPRPVSERTLKSYLSAARSLLESAGIERAADLTERHVRSWLRRRPGRANDVHRFLSWLHEAGGPKLDARPRPRRTVRTRERAMLRKARVLVADLTSCNDMRRGRALLVRAIAAIHGVRLERVLDIRSTEVGWRPESIELRIDGATVELGPVLSRAFLQFADRSVDMPFVGRAGIAPASADGTRYHLCGAEGMTR